MASSSSCRPIVAREEIKRYMIDCMTSAGASQDHAATLAETLELADYRGHYSHGLNRLDMYVRDVQAGTTNSNKEPQITKETVSIAHVDGNNLLGPVVGKFCMNVAMKKAKETGIGMVVANNSNHFSIAGVYGLQATKEGLIGMSFTNSSPLVNTPRSKKVTLGTNPICFATPSNSSDKQFVLDMATSAVALGKVELQNRKNEPVPEGWGCDSEGNVTTDGQQVMNGGGLLPLGGTEALSGYKGFGLAMMVEILCGVMSNANYGPHIRSWKSSSEVANLGQCFIAIDPEAFGPGFVDRAEGFVDSVYGMEPANADKPMMIPGDPERSHMKSCDSQGGVDYHLNQITFAEELATQLGVQPMKCK